jgi:phage terminase large subunit-like protein
MINYDHTLFYYDPVAADRVINWIEKYCRHVRGDKAGDLIRLDDWQKEDILRPAFGLKRKTNGKRKFKTVYVEIPKGNAKSTLGSAIALYLLGADGQKGAEVYSAAGDREQARIIFDNARFMIEQDKVLSKHYQVYQYSIHKRGTANYYKVISAESHTKHGFNPSGLLFDEVHIQPNRDLWDTLTAGQMKRDESICFAFTTAGFDKQSICWELHEKARKIKEGIITDDSFLGLIYTVDDKHDISDPNTWAMANPGLGTIISYDNLAIEYGKVIANSSYENTFRRLHLNQWTETYEAWIQDSEWTACDQGGDPELLKGKLCFGGLDLASTRDFNSLCLLFPKDEDTADVLMWFWIPADMIDKRIMQLVDFAQWTNSGWITTVEGNAVDHNMILNDIRRLSEEYNIQSIGYDRKFAAPIVVGLSDAVEMLPCDQSITALSSPTKQLDIMVAKGQLNHYGNPVLRWMVSNVKIYRDANDNIKIVKHKSTDKVDGVVALVMAIAQWMESKTKKNVSSYSDGHDLIAF